MTQGTMRQTSVQLTSALIGIFVLSTHTAAQEQQIEELEESAPPEGILPLLEYDGDIWSRPHLLGDLGGARSDLAARGLQFGIEWTQTAQGVVDGGRRETTRYGGSLDYIMDLDLQRMGIMPGALLSFRAESRYGHNVNEAAGLLLPANTDALFPVTSPADDDLAFAITELVYTQYLSPHFGVFLGKLQTLDGDPNEFASGRGVSQFQNAAFVFNPVTSLTAPYSTLGAGAVWVPNDRVSLSSTFLNTADSSTTTGFGDFGEGWSWVTELQFQYQLGNLPGGQTLAFMYSGDNEFHSLGSRFVFKPPLGLRVEIEDDSWFLAWNAWQYLWVEDTHDGRIDALDGVPDLRGFGLFVRAGLADEDTNPIDWSLSGGMGGRGMIPGRDDDVFGVGYFYSHVQADKFSGPADTLAGIEDRTHGLEAFYNISLTPAAFLTLDVQILEDAFPATDTAVLVGARLHLRF